jgi:hypothetical protein
MGKFMDFGKSAADNPSAILRSQAACRFSQYRGRLAKRLAEKQGHLGGKHG